MSNQILEAFKNKVFQQIDFQPNTIRFLTSDFKIFTMCDLYYTKSDYKTTEESINNLVGQPILNVSETTEMYANASDLHLYARTVFTFTTAKGTFSITWNSKRVHAVYKSIHFFQDGPIELAEIQLANDQELYKFISRFSSYFVYKHKNHFVVFTNDDFSVDDLTRKCALRLIKKEKIKARFHNERSDSLIEQVSDIFQHLERTKPVPESVKPALREFSQFFLDFDEQFG